MAESSLLLRGGQVFDGRDLIAGRADVLVLDGQIAEVGRVRRNADVTLNVSGQVVLPGLIDCHVHVLMDDIDMWRVVQTPLSMRFYEAARNLQRALHAGITTVRDAAGADVGVKRALQTGLIAGPRLLTAVSMLSQTGGHGDSWTVSGHTMPTFPIHACAPSGLVDGVDAARRKVRELVRVHADWIKVAASGGILSEDRVEERQFRDDELAEIVGEAAAAGLPVMAHAHAAEAVLGAVRAGVRSVEHATMLDDAGVAMMAHRGTWLVPTLAAPRAVVRRAQDAGVSLPTDAAAKAAAVVEQHVASLRRAYRGGVAIAMGTDSGVGPHGRNVEELELMQGAGMDPMDVLRAATGSAAQLLHLEDQIGFVRPGHIADLVVLRGDAGDLTGVADRISAVVQAGRVVRAE